jgi:YegS/Rv2252/BmrU family lipid kinase
MKKIHAIVNPAAGTDFPIVNVLYRNFREWGHEWDISIPRNEKEMSRIIKNSLKKEVDLIMVYGGDGTVTSAAKTLSGSNTPLAILPGGTANVMAKELELPLTAEENLKQLLFKPTKIKKIDMAISNGKLFALRVNAGIFADMVTQVNKNLKKTIGQLAYGIKALQKLAETDHQPYEMVLDGKKMYAEGIALMIANTDNVGFSGVSMFPDSSIADGKLDIIVLQSKDIGFLTEAATKAMNPTAYPPMLRWQAKEIKLKLPKKQTLILDDEPIHTDYLDIKVLPKSLSVLVPK